MKLDEQIAAVVREIGMRKAVYPGRVAAGKMKKEKADHELAAMEAVLQTLRSSTPSAAADEFLRLRKALEQCVAVAKQWHGDDAFDLYFNHSPEMKPIRDVLGKMPEAE